ncbi:MAG: hypothetical protein JO255_19550 [Alphaproteobacteria bacterium]|nr:hypothetical protein [Alphaproteobacteria bacterium]
MNDKPPETEATNGGGAPPVETKTEPEPSPVEEEVVAEVKEAQKRGRLDQFIPDIVRRTFYAGLGAVFTTEEGIRKLASDFHLPKDITNYLIQQAASSKDELFRVVGKELRGFLETVNISGELQKLLTSLSFEIKTEIRFIPNDQAVGGVKPDMKVGRMSIKRAKKKDDGSEGGQTG